MSEAHVSLKSQNIPARIGFSVLLVLTPAYVLFLIWFWMVLMLAVGEGSVQGGAAGVLMFSQGLGLVFMVLGLLICSDRTIFCNRDGIALPFLLFPSLRFRSELSWQTLQDIRFIETEKGEQVLALFFQTGKTIRRVCFRMNDLSEQDKQQLLVALEVWAGGTARFAELENFRIQCGNAAQAIGHTQMWEDELARRFGATNFVPLEPGATIRNGEFQIVRQVAFGGLSAVYLVQRNKEKFILKEAVVPSDADEQLKEKAAQMFQREAQILTQIEHPSIVRVLDHFVENGRNYLLLDYLSGVDLRKLVKEKGLPLVADVIDWAKQITEIVMFLHAQPTPIVHRDLTPDNLVLRDNGTVAAIDFGAANQFVGTATGTMIGKQAYIAPEQLRGKATIKSDIYALGCTIHFLLTGSDPEPLSVSTPSAARPGVPPWLDKIVQRCTEMEAADRPSAVEVMDGLNQATNPDAPARPPEKARNAL